ncbi:hypothetical protein [Bradyrhizobium sp. Ec3.3]|uniref:hypothetical protein n=1 Tax=Bradyrhizobium sp. Ec3.3 TaxID=189753 RepID=UPI00041B77BF|nr:hypothetical protein [Bradyrhizobium sp. Ec3.3]
MARHSGAKAPDAVGFYAIIAAATVIGFGLGFLANQRQVCTFLGAMAAVVAGLALFCLIAIVVWEGLS